VVGCERGFAQANVRSGPPDDPSIAQVTLQRIGQVVSFGIGRMGDFVVLSNASLKRSAASEGWRGYWLWQVAGNLAGFGGVQALTALMCLAPMHVAYPVTQGLAVIGVQVVAARWLFRETIAPLQWVGTAPVVAGIVLISARQ
jgi:multidrug transporter EmrE-like cation transporter